MRARIASGLALGALVVALTGCAGGGTGGGTGGEPAETGDGQTVAPETSEAVLTTAESDFGEIVVDGEGMTVYMFDQDTQGSGESSCEGQCAANWPAVIADSETPEVEGVTGEVGTIEGVDGQTQVTLNGWPLYYFAGDQAAGDVNGQGVNDVWWVLSPDGERITEAGGGSGGY